MKGKLFFLIVSIVFLGTTLFAQTEEKKMDITLYYRPTCPFCIKVENYMKQHKLKFEWIDSDTPEGNKIRQEESKKHNFKTIPMVFKDGTFVGGCNEFFSKL